MRIDDADYEELLALFPKQSIPSDPAEARQAIENFVDLVELLMRLVPLPPAGRSSFKQSSPISPKPLPQSSPLPGSIQEFESHERNRVKVTNALGFMYDEGRGAPQNFAQANSLYLRAMKKGNADVLVNRGPMYANGV